MPGPTTVYLIHATPFHRSTDAFPLTESATESKTRILVVEDEPIVALDLQLRLEKMGYHVPAVVASGEAALDAAGTVAPDLALMDINLEGEMDGVEAAERLAERQIPVVFLTAYSNDRTLERAKVTGPYGYLLKPFEERELQTTIEIALYKHQAQQALRQAHDELELRVAERTAELRRANEALQQEIEARGRREARRLALARIREEVWRMQSGADIQRLLRSIWEGLEALGVPFAHCGIHVVDAKADPPTVRDYDHSHARWQDLSSRDRRAADAVLQMWRRGTPVYRPDLRVEDPYGEAAVLEQVYGSVRSVLDVPFSHGTLAVNSHQAGAFTEDHQAVLKELAEALSEGFRRLEDLQELAAERERLAVTLRSIGDSVVATDADGRIVLMNRVAESLSGWEQAQARGRPFAEVFQAFDERTRQAKESPIDRVLTSGAAIDLDMHTVLVARDGGERQISTSTAPIRDDEGKTVGVVLVSRDVGAQRRMEEELLRSEKLESLGVLAGGIAHDFNNILTTIVGYLSLAKIEIDPESELYENLSEVEAAADRATDLTRQLLAFSKGGAPVKRAASMAEIIRDSATFTTRGSNVRCQFRIVADLLPAEVDRGQISQVIQNLVLNADQAMPDGGTVVVEGVNIEIGENDGLPVAPGAYLQISVSDDGVGIGDEHLARIFDPYFTTKKAGSGLGLATAYAIVKNHEGHITVKSEDGSGTRFDVFLPATPAAVVPDPEGPQNLIPGEGRILVLDDETQIRRLAMDLLHKLGYESEHAADGGEALEKYARARREGKPYDAVIMDLTIPGGMGGRETMSRLLELDPMAKAVVSSGYSDDPIMADYQSYGFQGVVAKPYDISELSEVLARIT